MQMDLNDFCFELDLCNSDYVQKMISTAVKNVFVFQPFLRNLSFV